MPQGLLYRSPILALRTTIISTHAYVQTPLRFLRSRRAYPPAQCLAGLGMSSSVSRRRRARNGRDIRVEACKVSAEEA